jgi:hypothetical protein
MANINTPWGDLVEEKTPRKEEKGWTQVNAPKKEKKTTPKTKESAPADPVAKKLDFDEHTSKNKFAILAEDSE